MLFRLAAAFAATPLCAAAPGPATVPVTPSPGDLFVARRAGGAEGDGSRAQPFSTIRAALEAARPGQRILVAAGGYSEYDLPLRPGVSLYGGFEAGSWRRDIARFGSVIDAGGKGRIFVCADGARVDGFVLRGGAARGHGGAVDCDGQSPEFSNNVWTGNKTLAPAGWKPKNLHEDAYDGGAVACRNGCRAVIRSNLFARNATEIGRGGAVAAIRAAPRIAGNVFFDNDAGLIDPMRSSDGGAASLYDRSHAEFTGNIVLHNRALNRNDGGGLFVALWSAPLIARNLFAGNYGDDDGGALFVGGQKHHYDTPLDPLPPAADFTVRIAENVFAGNRNASRNSGAFRITMESRVVFSGNLTTENEGVYFQRSEVQAESNLFMDDVRVTETKAGLAGYVFRRNRFTRGFTSDVPVVQEDNAHGREASQGAKGEETVFFDSARYDPDAFLTTVALLQPYRPEWTMRAAQAGDRWCVVQGGGGREARVWGDVSRWRSMRLLPAFEPGAQNRTSVNKGERNK